MKRRIYYLDKIKVLLCVLVICLHTAVAYGASGSWFYNEKNNNLVECAVLTMFAAICQSFFMGLFNCDAMIIISNLVRHTCQIICISFLYVSFVH